MGKTIGILSLKGGVGKTSSVIALGDAMSKFGKKVLLVDGNFSAPNLGLHLNLIEPEVTIHDVLSGRANPKDSVHNLDNFDLIPASIYSRKKISPLKLKDKIKTLKRKYDVILLDSSPSLDEETMGVMLASDDIILVTTPDHPTISNTLKAMKTAKSRGANIIGLIINKAHNKDFELSLEDIEDTTDVNVMAVIPHDVNVLKALSEFKPSTTHKPKSRGSSEYMKLGATLVGERYDPVTFREMFSILPKKQEINRDIYYDSVFDDDE